MWQSPRGAAKAGCLPSANMNSEGTRKQVPLLHNQSLFSLKRLLFALHAHSLPCLPSARCGGLKWLMSSNLRFNIYTTDWHDVRMSLGAALPFYLTPLLGQNLKLPISVSQFYFHNMALYHCLSLICLEGALQSVQHAARSILRPVIWTRENSLPKNTL